MVTAKEKMIRYLINNKEPIQLPTLATRTGIAIDTAYHAIKDLRDKGYAHNVSGTGHKHDPYYVSTELEQMPKDLWLNGNGLHHQGELKQLIDYFKRRNGI